MLTLPTDDWTSWLAHEVDTRLATVATALADVRAGTGVLARWNDADLALRDAGALAGLLAEVHPEEAVRTQAEDLAQRIDKVRTDRDLDPELFAQVEAADAGDDALAQRFRDHVLRDFRRAGVDRDEDVRTELRRIAERLVVLGQEFGRRVRDDVRTVKLRPEQLDGLPEDYRDAHPAGDGGLVAITTDYPDYLPFRRDATDADARRELTREFLNRAWPDNDATLREMLELRARQAQLLGFASWPAYDAAVKMVGSAENIEGFIDQLAEASGATALRDRERLLDRLRQDDPAATTLDSSQVGHYEELVRREQFDVDSQQVRKFFDFETVRAGLLDVTGRLFGVSYRPVDVVSWHEDVAAYDVVRDGEVIGRIRLDLHPREGKFKHAAQFPFVTGLAGVQQPEGVLVCNFSRGLMEHDQVVTLFHEFGHLLHEVLGGHQPYARFSGVATEWDFVEAPSQMLEEWAWDHGVLSGFARDAAGEVIPADLVTRMRAADEFGKGLWVRTQLYYTAVSFELHREPAADFATLLDTLQRKYSVVDPLADTHFQASFGHLTDYSSAYYTYLWSLVIAKDLFSEFDPSDLFAREVADRYRDRVLARGGAADAADLVRDFLGRDRSFDAFGAWLAREA